MKRTIFLTISILLVTAAPMWAQRGGSPKPKTTHVAKAPKVKTHAASPRAGHAGAKTTRGAAPVKATKTAKAPKPSKTTSTTTAGSTTTLSPVQLKLQKNTNLASKLQSRLPAGTNLTQAASGFRNLGQFVAAVNASHHRGIPFAELKTRMVDQGMSLGQAVQAARQQK